MVNDVGWTGNKDDAQEEKLRRIMALPDHLKAKARAVFFAKQRKGDFRGAPGGANAWQSGGGGGGGGNVCFAFQKGHCDRGDECKFSHEISGAGNANSAASEPAADFNTAAPNKRIRFDEDDDGNEQAKVEAPKKITFGDATSSRSERTKPVAGARPGAAGKGAGKPVCFPFQTGSCRRGSDCKFAHVLDAAAKEQVRSMTLLPKVHLSDVLCVLTSVLVMI